jgi:enamine deaminase RidA (YjgF/YER057c/UK114 family)
MKFHCFACETIPATVSISRFRGQNGVDEYHLFVRPAEHDNIEIQLDWVSRAYREALDSIGLDTQSAVFRRFFCSDLANQTDALAAQPFSDTSDTDGPCAISLVCQPPLLPAKVSLWAYHISNQNCKLDKAQQGASLILSRGELSHCWTTGLTHPAGETPYSQTRGILEEYEAFLRSKNMTLPDNLIRTWFFVQNIDANYQGLVTARKEFFAEHGLTPETHFVASTGIEGKSANPAAKILLDAYAIRGVRKEQIKFLSALDHLSPTHLYGVTFERGISITYRDRKHIFLSGTASIDHEGKIMHIGDLSGQLDRTIENIEALLKPTGASLKDICMMIAYVRDSEDQIVVSQQMRERFGDIPMEVVVAPVCRPGWLVEIEGKVIIPVSAPELPLF